MTDENKLLKSITDYLYEQNVRSDCGIESLASDLIEIAEKYFPRTDYDRMCFFLRDIGCKFSTGNNYIEIHPDSMITFGGVCIDFYDDGSFKGFVACE